MHASTTRDRIEDSNRPSGSTGWHGRYRKCATPPLPPVPADGRREATAPRRARPPWWRASGDRPSNATDRAGIFALQRADHLAHVLHTGCADILHSLSDGGLDLVLRHLLRQIGRDDGNLVAFLFRQLGAAALLVKLDRFVALFDHLLQHAQHRVVAERALALSARFDIGILEGRVDESQRRYL